MNFNSVIINVNTSKKNKFILNGFNLNGLFSINEKTIMDNNIELFSEANLNVYIVIEKQYSNILKKHLVNIEKVQILLKEDFFNQKNFIKSDEKTLIVDDNFYFNQEILNNLLTNEKYSNLSTLIKLNYNTHFDYIGIFDSTSINYIDFKNNSISDDIKVLSNLVELKEKQYLPIKIYDYKTLSKMDSKYECDKGFLYFTPGPVQIREWVKEVLGEYVNHHRSLSIKEIYKEAAENIKWAFNSKKGYPIAMANTGLGAIESTFVNLLEQGDEILILSNGFFGENLIDIAKRHQLNQSLLQIKQGESFDLKEVENLIKNKKAVFMVYMDTSCGILNPVKKVGELCKDYGCLFIVDAISGILNEEFNFDEYGVTAAVSTSGKGFEVSPGLAFVCVSEQGMQISANIKKRKPKFLDWQTFKVRSLYDGLTPSTYPVNIFASLNKVCEEIKDNGGLTRLIDKKFNLNLYLSESLITLGFRHIIENENSRSNWVLVMETPNIIKANELRAYLYAMKNILIECGIADSSNRIVRLAISAAHDIEDVTQLIEAIKEYIDLKITSKGEVMKKFYITTPIYYPSGNPHIGHAFTTLIADVLTRYKKKLGYETFFITGMDEHGQKIEEKAKELNLKPQELVDKYAKVFDNLWKLLGIEYSHFIRTTAEYHKNVVQETFSELLKKDFIYLGVWKGLYCVSCEENYTKNIAVRKENDDKLYCAQLHPLIQKEEESYFLKIKQFKKYISSFLKDPNLVYPITRINELFNSFLNNDDFDDLSISRSNFSWGIQIKENPKHVVYVWLDALLNYLSGLGYRQKDDSNFQKFWNSQDAEIVQLMSKEITRFHCIYWPIMLEMLGLRKPTKYISHGWIITEQGKMSKSLGNVLDPIYFINTYGRDAFRYYLLKELSLKEDSVFSEKLLINTFNKDLANNVGNLFNRSIGMINKYRDGIIPKYSKPKLSFNIEFEKQLKQFDDEITTIIEKLNIQKILSRVIDLINECNFFIEQVKPWDLKKENNEKDLDCFLSLILNAVKRVIYYLEPVLIDGSKEALKQFNIDSSKFDIKFVTDFSSLDNQKINTPEPIYLRIESEDK
ncbi:methionine--tRNA ligase [Malacoplasma penetrans]|nr:methionine--tRNA ligase [Malacoplasma penetrans]RXY97138.1 methionine--tRNA ligase [Malacoplasma penetrans]